VKLLGEVRELEDEYDDSVYDRWILEHQYRMAVARMQDHDPDGIAWLDEQVRRWESRREGFLEERRRLRRQGRSWSSLPSAPVRGLVHVRRQESLSIEPLLRGFGSEDENGGKPPR